MINSIIGWTTVIGSWARIEGLLNKCKYLERDKPDEETKDYYHNISNIPSCHEALRVLKSKQSNNKLNLTICRRDNDDRGRGVRGAGNALKELRGAAS